MRAKYTSDAGGIAIELPPGIQLDDLGRFLESLGVAFRRGLNLLDTPGVLEAEQQGAETLMSYLDSLDREVSGGWRRRPAPREAGLTFAATEMRDDGGLRLSFAFAPVVRRTLDEPRAAVLASLLVVFIGMILTTAEVRASVEALERGPGEVSKSFTINPVKAPEDDPPDDR